MARLIGRRFEQWLGGQFAAPFDARFGKLMIKTLSHLSAALGVSYGYAERTELSLYAVSPGGEARRLYSRIAGEAAAKLSLLLGQVATFETRLYQFPSPEAACRYFEWRMQESQAHGLDSYCQHVLNANGTKPDAAAQMLQSASAEEKIELLRQNDIAYPDLPVWQRRGAGVYLTAEPSGEPRLAIELNLPSGPEYAAFLRRFIA